MHWDVLKDQIVIATRSAVAQLFESHKSEDFYAIALYTDSGARTVCMAANSEQSFQKDWAAGLELEEEFTDADYAYSKWAFSEWSYAAWCAHEFREISQVLRESETDNFKKFKEKLFAIMVESLKLLMDEGVFQRKQGNREVIIFVSISDDDHAEAIENDTAKILNPPELVGHFLTRYDV